MDHDEPLSGLAFLRASDLLQEPVGMDHDERLSGLALLRE